MLWHIKKNYYIINGKSNADMLFFYTQLIDFLMPVIYRCKRVNNCSIGFTYILSFLNLTAAEILFVCRSLEYSESTTKRLKRMAGLQPPMEKRHSFPKKMLCIFNWYIHKNNRHLDWNAVEWRDLSWDKFLDFAALRSKWRYRERRNHKKIEANGRAIASDGKVTFISKKICKLYKTCRLICSWRHEPRRLIMYLNRLPRRSSSQWRSGVIKVVERKTLNPLPSRLLPY